MNIDNRRFASRNGMRRFVFGFFFVWQCGRQRRRKSAAAGRPSIAPPSKWNEAFIYVR